MCADVVSVRAGYDEFSLVILPNKLRSQPLWSLILYQTSCDVFLFFLKLGCSTEEFCSDILAVFFHFHVFTALNVFTQMLNQWNGTERNKFSSSKRGIIKQNVSQTYFIERHPVKLLSLCTWTRKIRLKGYLYLQTDCLTYVIITGRSFYGEPSCINM